MKVVATTRKAQGTSASRRLRHDNKVPGVLYGGDAPPMAIEVEHNPLFHSLRREKFHASILDMELDGRSEQVLLRDKKRRDNGIQFVFNRNIGDFCIEQVTDLRSLLAHCGIGE